QANTDIPGTGLGMAIAKQLIAQMQGEIEVFSPAVEFDSASSSLPGTSFIVWLPQLPHLLNQHPL
ncbi:ATP-binding protein, partial [Cylindrospermopsis raciborskii]